jgi:hypothetical protein
VEELGSLAKEVHILGRDPNVWASVSQSDVDRGHYIFWFYPNWEPGLLPLWGAIFGEIVHDLRSALDQLVCQFVILNGGVPDREHSFPVRGKEPANGFGVEVRREWIDNGGRRRHGPLFGVSDKAVALIERSQPYKGGNTSLVSDLHELWNADKHQTLIPTTLVHETPTVAVEHGFVRRELRRDEGKANVVELWVGRDADAREPDVKVEPHAPSDVLLSQGGPGPPLIDGLKNVAMYLLTEVLLPAEKMFPPGLGMGHPNPTRLLNRDTE